MNKKVKQIIIIGAVLIILIAALVVLLLTDKGDGEVTDTQTDIEETSVMLIDTDVKDLRSVEIATPLGTYSLQQSGETVDSKETTYHYTIEEFKDLPMNTDLMDTAAKTSTNIIANALIEENSERLGEFGLDAPVATVKQTYYDGTVITYSVGNETPSGDQYYLTMNGENTVYEVAKTYVEDFMNDKTYFIDCVLLGNVSSYPDIDELTVTRGDWERPVKIVPMTDEDWLLYKSGDESVTSSFSEYKMISPVETTLDIADQSGVMFSLWGMSADSAVKGNPTAQEISACGLDNPYASFEMIIDGKSTKLVFGDVIGATDEDGNTFRYGMLMGRNVIYSFKESDVYWLKFSPDDVITRMVTSPYIYNVSYIKINHNGNEYKFNITPNNDDLDNSVFEYNGTNLDGSKFRSFYQYLHKTMIQSICYDNIDKAPDMTIEYGFANADIKPITVEFYTCDTRTVYVGENGKPQFTTTAAYYERLIDNINRLINGENIILSW